MAFNTFLFFSGAGLSEVDHRHQQCAALVNSVFSGNVGEDIIAAQFGLSKIFLTEHQV